MFRIQFFIFYLFFFLLEKKKTFCKAVAHFYSHSFTLQLRFWLYTQLKYFMWVGGFLQTNILLNKINIEKTKQNTETPHFFLFFEWCVMPEKDRNETSLQKQRYELHQNWNRPLVIYSSSYLKFCFPGYKMCSSYSTIHYLMWSIFCEIRCQ